MHAIVSVMEELDAIDWYRQRAVLRIDEPAAICAISAHAGPAKRTRERG